MRRSGSCWEVARLLEPHVDRVVVVSPDDTGIASARAKTDKLDARTLAGLLWKGELEAVWMPDERVRVLRRRLARREQLVRGRSRAKNEVHAVLMRRLQGKPPCSDLFGIKGRQWLAALELPIEERESVDAGIRHIEFLDLEIAAVERLIAQQALSWPEIRRLMTVPGVNLIGAASFIAAIGDPNQVLHQPQARRISRAGPQGQTVRPGARPHRPDLQARIGIRPLGAGRSRPERGAAAGPLHAFYQRVKARRGHGKAIVATARKLAVLFWCMLTRGEDYAHQQRSLTRQKLRRLELTAGAAKYSRRAAGQWATNELTREAERELAQQAEISYSRMVQDQQASAGEKSRRGRDTGARIN